MGTKLISQITATQSVFKGTDYIEVDDAGTSKKELMSVLKTGVDPNPMTALADIIVGGVGGIWGKLGINSANQKLFVKNDLSGLEWGYGTKVVDYTRDMAAVSGDVSYTGATFKPHAIIIIAGINGNAGASFGFSDFTISYSLAAGKNGVTGIYEPNLTDVVCFYTGTGALQEAVVKTADTDGCTLTWIKTGSPTGTSNFVIMYFR